MSPAAAAAPAATVQTAASYRGDVWSQLGLRTMKENLTWPVTISLSRMYLINEEL